jgi:hypothetical protein
VWSSASQRQPLVLTSLLPCGEIKLRVSCGRTKWQLRLSPPFSQLLFLRLLIISPEKEALQLVLA